VEEERKRYPHAIEKMRKSERGIAAQFRADYAESRRFELFGECAEIAAVSRVRNVRVELAPLVRQGKASRRMD